MYPDPNIYAPKGIGKNFTYPNAPWLSSEAVPLGGVYGELGDPLSKGVPAKEGIFQKSKKDWHVGLPILLQPISYGTARSLLEEVGGKDEHDMIDLSQINGAQIWKAQTIGSMCYSFVGQWMGKGALTSIETFSSFVLYR